MPTPIVAQTATVAAARRQSPELTRTARESSSQAAEMGIDTNRRRPGPVMPPTSVKMITGTETLDRYTMAAFRSLPHLRTTSAIRLAMIWTMVRAAAIAGLAA